MKRRNAETGKMRRAMKRTKIAEGIYGNSMIYLKFVMLWATVVMADYMLEFRFEFIWPFWMMLQSMYDSYKYQGIAYLVLFICIALTSDLICFFFIPIQYLFLAASTYVWVQYVCYTFADKGICLPTAAICCALVYVEGALRTERASGGAGAGGIELCRPLAAHCVGYPVVTLGVSFKSYVSHRLRLRRQRQVRADNEFYFQLMRDAPSESAIEQSQQSSSSPQSSSKESDGTGEARHMNGSLRRRGARAEPGAACPAAAPPAPAASAHESEKQEKHPPRDRPALSNGAASGAGAGAGAASGAAAADDDEHRHDHTKGSAKSSKSDKKESSTQKEERRRSKNKDKDRDSIDSHKNTEHTKEQIVKEAESTNVKNKDNSSYKEKEKDKERERENREREREREREKERERELRTGRECAEELRRVRAELAAARGGEEEARRALAAAVAAERARRAEHAHLKQAHAQLQHKMATWRSTERAALERRLADERRARTAAEHQLLRARQHAAAAATATAARSTCANGNGNGNGTGASGGECESEWCRSRRALAEAEAAALRRDTQRARDRAAALQRDLQLAADQVRCCFSLSSASARGAPRGDQREHNRQWPSERRRRGRAAGVRVAVAAGARGAPRARAVRRDARQAGPALRAGRRQAAAALTGRRTIETGQRDRGTESSNGGRDAHRVCCARSRYSVRVRFRSRRPQPRPLPAAAVGQVAAGPQRVRVHAQAAVLGRLSSTRSILPDSGFVNDKTYELYTHAVFHFVGFQSHRTREKCNGTKLESLQNNTYIDVDFA